MKKILFIGLVLFVGTIFFGCASTKPVSQQYPDRWEKTYIGITLDEFKRIWPEAKYNGSGDLQNTTEVWFFSAPRLTHVDTLQSVYFIFQKNKLIKFYEQ